MPPSSHVWQQKNAVSQLLITRAIEAEEIRKQMHGLMIRAVDSHPLICEDVVLCEMSREKLHRFKLDKLKAICSHFGINTQSSKKKIHYVDKLLE